MTDYDPAFLGEAAAATYGDAFAGKAGYVQKVHDGLYSLELWHGPTCAFKDYALQLMPKLLVQAKKNLGRTETTRILVATSGDTGKAALAGYAGLPGIEIEVFYPDAGTSEIQRLQMATQAGDNVSVYAVNGNFDDAQTGVKRVFGDASVAEELEKRNICLSSANSINWGRLVPQIVYYFYAYFRLVEQGNVAWGQPVDFCVPTGNFGNILAGWYAKQMGLPVRKLIGQRVRGVQHLGGEVFRREIVILPRPLFVVDDQLPIRIELLQHRARRVGFAAPIPAPMDGRMPVNFPRDGQLLRAHGAVCANVVQRLRFQRAKALKLRAIFARCPAVTREIGPILHREDGEILVRIIDERAVCIEQFAQHRLGKAFHARLQREFRIFAAGVHGVELDTARLPHEFQRARLAYKAVWTQQAVPQEQELPRLPVGEMRHGNGRHGGILL